MTSHKINLIVSVILGVIAGLYVSLQPPHIFCFDDCPVPILEKRVTVGLGVFAFIFLIVFIFLELVRFFRTKRIVVKNRGTGD